MSKTFEKLKKLFTILPGVGPRQATRFVLSLLNRDETELIEFARLIANLKQEIKLCTQCFYVGETDRCYICLSPKRDTSKIMVVEKISDLESIERTGHYQGHYHVLGGAINPVDGINAERLTINQLNQRVKSMLNQKNKKPEIILALSPTPFGNTTAIYIEDKLKKFQDQIQITHLGRGISFGTSLEYVDEITLKD